MVEVVEVVKRKFITLIAFCFYIRNYLSIFYFNYFSNTDLLKDIPSLDAITGKMDAPSFKRSNNATPVVSSLK